MYIRSVIQAYKSVHNNVLRGAQGWTCRHATLVGGTALCTRGPYPLCLNYKLTSKLEHLRRAAQSSREWKWDKHGVICPACSDLSKI